MKLKFSHLLLLVAAVTGCALSACSDDDEAIKNAIGSPTATIDAKTYNRLSFTWESVPNAIQYGYALANPLGTVVGEGTTVYNTASFSGLLPNTEYTLKVWAFPSTQSDYAASPAFVLTATTEPLTPLGIPQPVWSKSGSRVTISWDAVDQASSYTYSLTGPGYEEPEDVEIYDTSVSFVGLPLGTYEFTVYANSASPGYETKSEKATIAFTIEPLKNWRAMGYVYYGYYNSDVDYPAILSYDNDTDTYSLLNWCNVAGYDLKFTLTDTGLTIVDSGESNSGYFQVPTGMADPAYLNVYCLNDYSSYDGDMDEGIIWLCYYTPDWSVWDYMSFQWEADSSHPTIDQICGSYSYDDSGYEYYTTWGTWNEFSYSDQSSTITKLDDTNVWFSTLLSYPGFEASGFQAEYDPQNLTLYAPIQQYAEYYILGLENDDYSNGTAPEEGVTAYLQADGSIAMSDWVVYYLYSGWYYKYFAYCTSLWH